MAGPLGTKMKEDLKDMRKALVVAVVQKIALFWEAGANEDARWNEQGHMALVNAPADTRTAGVKFVPQGVKDALNTAVANARGSGVRSLNQVAVGMAIGRSSKPVKRKAASSQEGAEGTAKKVRVEGKLPESTCRNIEFHGMWNYYLTGRRLLLHNRFSRMFVCIDPSFPDK